MFRRQLLALLFLCDVSVVSQTTQPPATSHSGQVAFEDDRIRVEVPTGWSLQPVVGHTGGVPSVDIQLGALLTKGRYKIYLLTHSGHASGIAGGRFSEIVQYVSPWIDMSEAPWLPCPTSGSKSLEKGKLSRYDFYFDTLHANRKALKDCGSPTMKGNLWYGSHFAEECVSDNVPSDCGGPFLDYSGLGGAKPRPRTDTENDWTETPQAVYAVTFDTLNPNELPRKDDPRLGRVLQEATAIVNSIVYK